MVSKNNKKILTEKNSNKVTKYKLKKFKVGLTSVAVGSLMFVGVGQVDVLAAETNIVDKVVVSESLEKAVVEVNKTDLTYTIKSVGNILASEKDYTVESFNTLVAAFDAATAVYDNEEATQADADQANVALQSAVESLEKAVVEVNKTDLYDVIISVGNIVTHENDFTVESFDNMGNAFDVATTVYDNKNATQAEVDQAKTDLQSAIEALEKAEKSTDLPLPELEPSKPTAPEVTVDDKKESIDPTLEESEPLKPVKSEVSAALEAKKTEKNEGEMLPKTSTATFSLGALGLVSLFGGAVSSFKKK